MNTSQYPESRDELNAIINPDMQDANENIPPIGTTAPAILAQDAAAGHRGAAWRFLYWIMENDPRAIEAMSAIKDERLTQHLLEFIALGTWAGKPMVVPPRLRSSYTRTRLCTLFLTRASMDSTQTERILFKALHDSRPAMRATACTILGIIGSHTATPQLTEALSDPIPMVRIQAARALEQVRDPASIPALVKALRGADEQMTTQIFSALTILGHAAVPALIDLSNSHSAWIRWNSVRALGKSCDELAIPVLVKALRDSDHAIAWAAAKGLAEFGSASIEPVLRTLTAGDITPWLMETAAYVLSHQREKFKPYLNPVIVHLHGVANITGTAYVAHKALIQLHNNNVLLREQQRT